MRVKRYVADSIQEAITRVKNDLGRNAIILHTKPFKEGGFLGFFCRRRFEVIAAVDETITDNGAVSKKNEPKAQPSSQIGVGTASSLRPAAPVEPEIKTPPVSVPIQSAPVAVGSQQACRLPVGGRSANQCCAGQPARRYRALHSADGRPSRGPSRPHSR